MNRGVVEFRTTRTFGKAFSALSTNIQERALEKLALYKEGPHHASLRVKKVQGTPDILEMRISRDYRITFQRDGNVVLLRNVGTHDILKHSKKQQAKSDG